MSNNAIWSFITIVVCKAITVHLGIYRKSRNFHCKNTFVVYKIYISHAMNLSTCVVLFQITKLGYIELIPLKIFCGCPRPRKYFYTK